MLELELIEFIYQGVDPRTGELLNTPRDPVLDKHRAAYLQTLRKFTRKRKPAAFEGAKDPKLAPQNQGARWSIEADDRLRTLWCSDERPTIEELAVTFERSEGGICSRLVKLGIFPDLESARLESKQRTQVQQNKPVKFSAGE